MDGIGKGGADMTNTVKFEPTVGILGRGFPRSHFCST